MRRSLNGDGWYYDGRHLATFLMSRITAGGYISDFFPYSIIFSAIIMTFAGYIITSTLELEKCIKYKLSPLILLINPFFLENLSYRWDSLPMAISIVCILFPFIFLNSPLVFILCTIIAVFSTMLTYQASIVIFPLMAVVVLINRCLNDEKKIFRYIFTFLTAFLTGLLIYKLCDLMNPFYTGTRDTIILFKENFILNLSNNIKNAWELIQTAFTKYFKILIVLSALISLGIYINVIKEKHSFINKILIIPLSFLIILFIPIIFLLLKDPWLFPRLLVGFPFIIYLLLVFFKHLSQKIISIICFLFILISLPLMAAYANALKAQNSLEIYIAQKISNTINIDNKKLAFAGKLELSPEIKIASEIFPLLQYMVPSYMFDNWFWGRRAFAKANCYMYFPPHLDQNEYMSILNDRQSLPIIDETYYYILRADSTRIMVDFANSKSKKTSIKVN